MSPLDAAIRYAELDLATFPLEPRDKRPHTTLAPHGFKDATTDPVQLRDWWTADPEAGVGLPCEMNKLVTVDVDARSGGLDAWRKWLGDRKLPMTWKAKTGGGGLHYVFKLPTGVKLRGKLVDPVTGEVIEGVDIKVAGYIAVEPTVHPSGVQYKWRPGYAPWDRPVAEAPDFLIAAMTRPDRYEPDQPPPVPAPAAPVGDRLTEEEIARRALAEMNPARADDYATWIEVGQALHHVGDHLLDDWLRWSSQSTKYDEGVCRDKWRSFRRGAGRTLGTVIEYARQDGSNLLQPGSRASEREPRKPRLRDADTMGEAMPQPSGDDKPVISTDGRQLADVVDDALEVLKVSNDPPSLFRRSGHVVRVQWDETDWPTINDVAEHALRGRLARMADWHGSRGRPIDPPAAVSQTILAEPSLPLPPLIGLTQTPTMRPDGSVLWLPGYDPATKLFYAPPGRLQVPRIPDEPTTDQIMAARDKLLHVIAEFPFAEESSRANLLATWLTPVNRAAINGPTGCAVVDAPSPGTGKSLLVESICRTASGRSTFLTAPKDEDEWRKRITSLLMSGSSVVVIDNISGVFRSDQLAAAITADWWEDRELGKSGMVRIQQRAMFIATGNNIALGGDLPRRCYRIHLDAECARPWEREGFEIADLRAYVDSMRGELLAALLTLSRAWWGAGCPQVKVRALGGFESWCSIIGGILANAGIEGFLGNQDEVYEQADEGGQETEAFLRAWREVFGDRAMKVAEVVGAMKEDLPQGEALRAACPSWAYGTNSQIDARKLGNNLRVFKDRRYGADGLSLKRSQSDKHSKVVTWKVVTAAGTAGSSGYSSNPNVENGKDYDQFIGRVLDTTRLSPQSPQPELDVSDYDETEPEDLDGPWGQEGN
ncbi:MAG: hypothetical protein MOGMAGMI_02458 [Candidatus Omnitrophica bacterium]|nr:hypothetical protein [Candidatus Omnitrophota bacterium]